MHFDMQYMFYQTLFAFISIKYVISAKFSVLYDTKKAKLIAENRIYCFVDFNSKIQNLSRIQNDFNFQQY